MKFFVLLFAVLKYTYGDCGCLRCSDNLAVGGHVVAEHNCGPIKVLYRTDGGRRYMNGLVAFSPLPIVVQKPVLEEAPVRPGTPLDCQYRITQVITNTRPNVNTNYRGGSIYPVRVQTPLPLPSVVGGNSVTAVSGTPLLGLQACVDRIVLPAPPNFKYQSREETNYRSTCTSNSYSGSSCRYNVTISINGAIENISNNITTFRCLNTSENGDATCNSRTKRQIPILNHGYKFLINMLPKFIQEPIKHTVNVMALSHPDKRMKELQQAAPRLTREKKLLEHRNKVLQQRLDLYKRIPPARANLLSHRLTNNEVSGFIDSLQDPLTKKRSLRLRQRSEDSNEDYGKESRSWLDEYRAKDIIGDDLTGRRCIEEDRDGVRSIKKDMSLVEQSLLMHKLKRLNTNTNRAKRTTEENNDTTEDQNKDRKKRSTIVIDSEELAPPIYRIKVKDNLLRSRSKKGKRYDIDEYDYDEDNSYENKSYKKKNGDDIIRKLIRKELRKMKDEEGDDDKPFHYKKMVPKSPIMHLLTLPAQLISGFDRSNFPSIGSLPEMIVGTKRYFRDFGKNLRRNILHFASNVIGDFDPHPTDRHFLIRKKRSHTQAHVKIQQYEPEYSLVFSIDDNDDQSYQNNSNLVPNFQNAGESFQSGNDYHRNTNIRKNNSANFYEDEANEIENSESGIKNNQNFQSVTRNKVRKKRYVMGMVNEDDIEEYVKQKLEKILLESSEDDYSVKPRRHEESMCPNCRKRYKHRYSDETDNYSGGIVVEKVVPKVIIDNNGLPFMEIDGFKRPLFLTREYKRKNKHTLDLKMGSSSEEVKYVHYDSSEEVTCDKIHHILTHAHNTKPDTDVPIQNIRETVSEILYETDLLIHMDFEKYDEIFDELVELQCLKTSIVQDWRRVIMSKRCNDRDSKITLLTRFKDMQHLKKSVFENVIGIMYHDAENKFMLRKLTKVLIRLQKLQCIINQVVGCFENKFARDLNFEMDKDIKFVDILAGINFVPVRTRHDIICRLQEERNKEIEAKMELLDKLKKILTGDCEDDVIKEQADLLWQVKNLEKMRNSCIEEMYERLQGGHRVKKNLKVLFDLSKRLDECQQMQTSSNESEEEEEDDDKESVEVGKETRTKMTLDELREKIQEKIRQHRELVQKRRERYKKMRSKDSED